MTHLLNYKNILAVAVMLIAIVIASLVFQSPREAFGSTYPGGEYTATTTLRMGKVHNPVLVNTPVGFGSIIVASSSATTMTIWNATSTTDTASTSVVTLKAAITEGTYVFDSQLTRGLVVVIPTGFNGEYIVTYR